MLRVARAGATIVPLTVTLYNRPGSVQEVIDQFIGRLMDLLGLESDHLARWEGPSTGSGQGIRAE